MNSLLKLPDYKLVYKLVLEVDAQGVFND